MSLVPYARLDVQDVLCHFMGQTNAPSSMGSQLERLATQSEAKKHGPGWTTRAKATRPTPKDPDGAILRDATIAAASSEFARISDVRDIDAPLLVSIVAKTESSIGAVATKALRLFQAALAAPSDEDIDRANRRAARVPEEDRSRVFQLAIAQYREPRGLAAVQAGFALKKPESAAELYSDSLALLDLFVKTFNARHRKRGVDEASKTWTAIADLNVGIPQRTLRRWCQDGRVRAEKVDGAYYVQLDELLRIKQEENEYE